VASGGNIESGAHLNAKVADEEHAIKLPQLLGQQGVGSALNH
jgi:hypothetical protein